MTNIARRPLERGMLSHAVSTTLAATMLVAPAAWAANDTHLHTAFSMDAGAFGARLTPRDAYVFARGDEVRSPSGLPQKVIPLALLFFNVGVEVGQLMFIAAQSAAWLIQRRRSSQPEVTSGPLSGHT